MSELFAASMQWANRPDDERFENMGALLAQMNQWRAHASEVKVPTKALTIRAEAVPNGKVEPMLIGPNGGGMRFTHYGFGQFARMIGAPSDYLRSLPSDLASQAMAHGLANADKSGDSVILMHSNGTRSLRAITSERYTRVWNADVAEWAGNLGANWQVPPARPARPGQKGTRVATQDDILHGRAFGSKAGGLSINVGDMIAPAGLYASDHDMFIFMVDQTRPVVVGNEVLYRGFFMENNEVGAGSLKLTMFLYDTVCGNHIVWGAQKVVEYRIRHMGEKVQNRFTEAKQGMIAASETSDAGDMALIQRAMAFNLGTTKEAVMVATQGAGLSKRLSEQAYVTAVEFEDVHGSPNTAWGQMSALTRLSQATGYADDRDAMDRKARSILEMAF